MPIGLSKAPDTLPKEAQRLWVDTFNGALEDCEGTTQECDEKSAKIAWDNVKRDYRQVKDTWVAKSETTDAYHDVLLTITKASLQPDGTVRWQAVASDTGKDKADEATSVDLFQDWIDRVTYKADVGYLPEPKMPFLGVSHYPALDGFGEAGTTRRMYIDGNVFKADGVFATNNPIGKKLLDAVKTELALIKKGGEVEKPIRISAGWWDIQHYHDDSNYIFTRQSLTDKCPICEKGQTTDKIYKAGQLDHFAATRVPMNPRTSLGLEVKSMANKITRQEDAESIIGAEDALEIERRARMVGKAATEEELPEAMVTKADEDDLTLGGYMRDMRKKKKLDLTEVAKRMKVKEDRLKRLEADEDEMDNEAMETMATALKMSAEEKEDMLARFGNKRRKTPPTKKAITEDITEVEPEPDVKMDYEGDEYKEPMMANPLGGAKSLKDAEGYIVNQEKMDKMYSYWDMLQVAYFNIQRDPMTAPADKIKEVSNLFREMGGKIDTLKAGLSDAFLIQESTAAYDTADEFIEDEIYEDEVTIMENEITHPADQMKAAIDTALANKALTRPDREKAIQEAFNEYAQTVEGQLNQADPLPPADQIAGAIKGALADVLGPLTEQVGLLTAKMNAQPQPQPQQEYQQVHFPQQKSMTPIQTPQPVQAEGNGQGHHVSPVLGKPSPLTDQIRKSVGLHS